MTPSFTPSLPPDFVTPPWFRLQGIFNKSNCPPPLPPPSQKGIMRCKRCRTYINPYVGWLSNGRQWRCNVCGMVNDTPPSYHCHLDQQGQRSDRAERPELGQASVELVRDIPPFYFLSAFHDRTSMILVKRDSGRTIRHFDANTERRKEGEKMPVNTA